MKTNTNNTNTNTNNNTNMKKGENTMKTTNTNTMAIEFKQVARKNEKVLVYDIRCALIDRDEKNLLSLCKAWMHMVDNGVVSDAAVVGLVNALELVAYTGKYATVKERKDGKQACMDVVTSGRVKAWLYTIRRNGYKAIAVQAEKGERPEEKACKTPNKKTTIKIDENTKKYLELVKALTDAGIDMDTIASLAKQAC